MSDLTDKQRRFCEEYVIDWNATRAAKIAGYSAKTSYSIGQENLKKPEIAAYIELIQKDLQKIAGVSALRNMIELRKIAYSDLTDLKKDWFTEKEFEELTPDQKACISEITSITRSYGKGDNKGTERTIKFKLHSKLDAIDKLNKMLPGAYVPIQKDVTTGGDKINKYDEYTENQLNERINKLIKYRANRTAQ